MLWPRYSRTVDLVNRYAQVREWLRQHRAEVTSGPRSAYFARLAHQIGDDTPVSFLEFGVWRGESLQAWSSLNHHPASRFWGFDTFTGLPEDWKAEFPAGAFDLKGISPSFSDPRVRVVPGLFQRSLPEFLASYAPGGTVVVHIDCDLYSAALYVLTTLDPFLRPGSWLLFDEFRWPSGEFQAFQDYQSSHRRRCAVVAVLPDEELRVAFVIEA